MVATARRALRVRLLAVALVHALTLAFGYALLGASELDASWWLLGALTVSVVELGICWRYLRENHPTDGVVLATLGVANVVTLSRGVLVVLAAGFLFVRPVGAFSWLPTVLCALAGIGDYLDGWVARRVGRGTALGAHLDIEFDALATAVVTSLAVSYGQVPSWYLAVGLARYVFVVSLALRQRLGRPVASLPDRSSRRYLYVAQFIFATLALSPVFGPPVTRLVAIPVAIAFLLGFLRDWLTVTGRLTGHTTADQSASKGQ